MSNDEIERLLTDTSRQAYIADITVLMRSSETDGAVRAIATALKEQGYTDVGVHVADIHAGCAPDNILVTEYEQRFEKPPMAESLYRIVVGVTAPAGARFSDVTARIAASLPSAPDGSEALWYGGTRAGRLRECDLAVPIVCRMNEPR
ncbi:hypothetical protein [Corynebacterium anserum]|uniref:Uncharacterized protein n=1 Tax=Corynebacterium anserum TaxID=2684406 RepID=A0A7G7YNW2_9CORY|nr:hypothetical protein [Corynebacterium anserum]MBC2681780.1 hypothetical protein [Corynebacterium anserum]QNH96182.1 hypothetical protein GP473_05490 [Corynebacterium anserum]